MNNLWSLVCLVGLWGFVGATIGLILKAFPARGVFAAKPGALWGAAALVFFILWLVGMSHA